MTLRSMVFLSTAALLGAVICSGCSQDTVPTSEVASGPTSQTSTSVTEPSRPTAEVSVNATPGLDSDYAKLPHKIKSVHLPNAIRIHDKVISGGQPDGEEAFQELQDLGIKTIISVDGAKPDLELAKKHGFKYIHLPHSYDGIPEQRAVELAKAVRDSQGPIYIHCHHGKHRSPAAAAVACIGAGLIESSMSSAILKLAGTNPNYRGLYQSAESARKLESAVLDAMKSDFPESAQLPPMAEAMVHLEHTQDRVKMIAAAGWKSPASRPDVEPAQEVLLLGEHFTELLRSESVAKQPEEFRSMLRESETAAVELEAALTTWNNSGAELPIPDALPASFEKIARNCVACHTKYRDVPLNEKPQ